MTIDEVTPRAMVVVARPDFPAAPPPDTVMRERAAT